MDAEWRTKCRSAVIALFGRTPREGTAGHVASRRGLIQFTRPGGRRAEPLGGCGQSGGGPADGAGLDRGETRGSGGSGRTPLPCREADPAAAERASRRKPGSRPLPERHVAAAASDGSAKCVEGLNAAMLRIRSVSRIEATDRPSQLSYPTPAPRSRGAAVAPLRAVRGPGASPPPVSGQREISPGGRPRCGSRGRGQGSDPAISATPCLANRSFSASPSSAWTVLSASAASRLSWRRTSGAK